MAETQQGTMAIVWGLPDPTMTVTGTSAAGTSLSGVSMGMVIQAIPLDLSASEAKTYDVNGELVNVTTYNQVKRLSVTARPKGSSKSAAQSANVMPLPGSKAVITDATSTLTYSDHDLSAASSGVQYRVVSVNKTPSANSPSQFTVVLEREGSITDYTAVS